MQVLASSPACSAAVLEAVLESLLIHLPWPSLSHKPAANTLTQLLDDSGSPVFDNGGNPIYVRACVLRGLIGGGGQAAGALRVVVVRSERWQVHPVQCLAPLDGMWPLPLTKPVHPPS